MGKRDLRFIFGRLVGQVPYLTQRVFTVVLHKSTPPQIRQLTLYYYLYEEQVDEFVWELTFAKNVVWDANPATGSWACATSALSLAASSGSSRTLSNCVKSLNPV